MGVKNLSSVHRHLDYVGLHLSRWVGYSMIHRSLIGETLKELLLLLRVCSVFSRTTTILLPVLISLVSMVLLRLILTTLVI